MRPLQKSMKRWRMWLVMLAGIVVPMAVLAAESAGGEAPPKSAGGEAPPKSAGGEAPGEMPKESTGEAPAKPDAQDAKGESAGDGPGVFIPSEEISEDYAVPFPVDI